VRTLIPYSLVILAVAGLVALADDRGPANPRSRPAGAPASGGADRGNRTDRTEKSDAEREAAALAFVRENHAELADLLEQLKAMKPDQYERAINELWQIQRTLANYKKNEKRRYQPALDVWKARSRAELLAAQMAGTPDAALEDSLRAALKTQLDAEIRQQKMERELAAERLKKLDEGIQRLESRHDKLVESRYQIMVRKGQRARRQELGRSTIAPSATEKGENQE
jgi:hypothetical protein